MYNVYHARRLTVDQLNIDNEFACIRGNILAASLNMVATEEQMGDMKRSVRAIKEGIRCHVNTRIMVTGCVTKAIKDQNQLPS